MTGIRISTVAIAAVLVATAGTGGFLLSEMRHSEPPAAAAEAVPVTEPVDLQPVSAPAAAPAAEKPERQTDTSAVPVEPPKARPAAARPAPQPAAPVAAAPAPLPAVTSEVPVSTMPDTLGGLSALPLPALAPPVERIELVVDADSVVGVRLDVPVSSATAKVEDRVTATVTRAVIVDGRTAIPEGSHVEGYIAFVERGGKFREKARVGLQFSTLVMPNDERLPMATEAIYREGESPAGEATSKIGASAVVGTVLGAIIGGKKGAAIGGAAGAAGGTAIVAKGGTSDAVLTAGTALTLRLTEPVVVIVERR